MIHRSIAAAALALLAATHPSLAGQKDTSVPNASGSMPPSASADNRLMIVNGRTGRVIFDDGHDDQFCVIRRVMVGLNDDGRPIFRRTLHCR
jgi:hypothetical protein